MFILLIKLGQLRDENNLVISMLESIVFVVLTEMVSSVSMKWFQETLLDANVQPKHWKDIMVCNNSNKNPVNLSRWLK